MEVTVSGTLQSSAVEGGISIQEFFWHGYIRVKRVVPHVQGALKQIFHFYNLQRDIMKLNPFLMILKKIPLRNKYYEGQVKAGTKTCQSTLFLFLKTLFGL